MSRNDGLPNLLGRNPQIGADVVEALKTGCSLQAAAEFVGISYDSLKRWRTRGFELLEAYQGDLEQAPYAERLLMELALETNRAQAGVEIFSIDTIRKAAKGNDWRAAAWMLEHRFPERWSLKGEVIKAHLSIDSTDKLMDTREAVSSALDKLAAKLELIEGGASVQEVIEAEVVPNE